MIADKYNPSILAAQGGTQTIGAGQRTIAYSAVAASPTSGYIRITATGHNLKKGQYFYIGTGAYSGIRRVKKVISANVIETEGTFGSTASGNLNLTAAMDGQGFIVDETPLTIADIVPDNSTVDVEGVKSRTYVAGTYIHLPFSSIRLSAGNITVIRKVPQTKLSYTNR